LADIFLSYSRDDLPIARRFAEAFEREGLSVWWDQTLNPGEAFDKVTERALEEANAVVVLWSKHSVDSRWVRAEATQANSNGTLVPVMIEACKRPMIFELTQTADLSRWRGNSGDPDWQAYLTAVKRQVRRDETGASSLERKPTIAARQRGIRPLVIAASVAALLIAGVVLWAVNKPPEAVSTSAHEVAGRSPIDADEVTLAVLPFANFSSDPEQEYFSDGLTEEILNQLAQIKGLRVTGRTSSFSFKGKNQDLRVIGDKLGVSNLLEGSVRKDGNQIRITAQLNSSKDGSHIWSKTYARELKDVFAVQEEIAKNVAQALSIKLDVGMPRAKGGTTNVEAYDAFLSARAIARSTNLNGAGPEIAALERAVSLDPDFANAWFALARAYSGAGDNYSRVPYSDAELRTRTSAAMARALELAPASIDALRAQADIATRARNWSEVERRRHEVLERSSPYDYDANVGFASFLLTVGRPKDAIAYWERAKRGEPLLIQPSLMLGFSHEMALEPGKADTEFEHADSLSGDRALFDARHLLRALATRDRTTLQKWLKTDNSALGEKLRQGFTDPSIALAELRRMYEDPANHNNSFTMSIVAHWSAFFGDEQLALQALRAFGPTLNTFFFWRPDLTKVRQLPGFKDLMREMGLVDYWRASGNWGEFCKPVGTDDFECH
jgi:TolB-like protein